MVHFFNNWFIAHRNARAWVTAAGLLSVLLWALWDTKSSRIEYKELSGTLVEIIGGQEAQQVGIAYGLLHLLDGKNIKIQLTPQHPRPKVGDKIPVVYERYDDGKEIYAFDNGRWIAGGGAI